MQSELGNGHSQEGPHDLGDNSLFDSVSRVVHDVDDLIGALSRRKPSGPGPGPKSKSKSKQQSATKESKADAASSDVEDIDVVVGIGGPQTAYGTAVLVDQIFQIGNKELAPA